VTPRDKPKNLYERAGIDDVGAFYRTLFASNELMRADYFDAPNRYDLRWTKTLWVYDNARRGSRVLDLGCGSGTLAVLKRKEVHLVGVDLSAECLAAARRNGYDETHLADLQQLPFPDASFDYVCTMDVLGHVQFEDKDAVLREIRRVLKPDGVTLHGVEALLRGVRKDYDEMTDAELRDFIRVDGHVGMEDEEEIAARFRQFFPFVETRPRYIICSTADELIKQGDNYGLPFCDDDFLAYVRALNQAERRAFDMAMGYVFRRLSQSNVALPPSGFVLVKASARELGDFYAEHAEPLTPAAHDFNSSNIVNLDSAAAADYLAGWHAAEDFPPVARWMGRIGLARFTAAPFRYLRLKLMSHLPELEAKPLNLEFHLNGKLICAFDLHRYGWLDLEIDAGEFVARETQPYELVIKPSRAWQPSRYLPDNKDERELSIAVCNLSIERL
jgi:ubiquinone/menaquinone biosynthesis C-methylase UbiE